MHFIQGHLNSRMLYEHYLIKPYDNPVRGTWKLKDWFNLCIGKETRQEEQGTSAGGDRLGG